ncbi:hypothetical protein [Flavobacterium hiemivividum]|uniref:Thioesterase n=1 Tax=Flavobacterium hiemivividum TaxID=2541734 RepID=A0A4R5CT52_9FLAO|nr:hypothetical protein [Flavobacterium hiemivividum]TDE03466.1 hypothetical protein E0F98_10310 [Flavobacterium hiemivividum]
MICKNYVVTGEDVNDYMIMESSAYISYTLRLLYHFLFNNGFSKQKLNTLHLGLQEGQQELVCYKNLMFTEAFFIEMKHCHIDDKIKIKSSFFNSKKECCAEVIKEVEWFDMISQKVIKVPKDIQRHFNLHYHNTTSNIIEMESISVKPRY